MKDIKIKSLVIPEIKVLTFGRYCDNRGYFTEPFRESEIQKFIFKKGEKILQTNESFSASGVIRGLHFQWDPYVAKLVRTLSGHMVDIIVDIRKDSPTFGYGLMYDMPADGTAEFAEWIWIPAGFAHGSYFKEPTLIEYYCTGEYNQNCEVGISPQSLDIDWSLCDKKLKNDFDNLVMSGGTISEKDKIGLSLTDWKNDLRSDNFISEKLR